MTIHPFSGIILNNQILEKAKHASPTFGAVCFFCCDWGEPEMGFRDSPRIILV